MQTPSETPSRASSPLTWPWAALSPPALSSEGTPWRGALLRSWRGTSPVMVQPPLDHHYLVMHHGGSKRVRRSSDGKTVLAIAEPDSLTIVPAGTAYVWKTEGPIAFSHLYLAPADVTRYAENALVGDGRRTELMERVAFDDPLLKPAFKAMVEAFALTQRPSALLLDSLLESICVRLAQRHMSTWDARPARNAESLPRHRLQRVLDFIDAHLAADISLADLAESAGNSPFHFSRAFQLATGQSPYRYVIRRRIDRARVLLMTTGDSLSEVSASCGFHSEKQFAVMFRHLVGVGPKRFRLDRPPASHGHASDGGAPPAPTSSRRSSSDSPAPTDTRR